MWNPHNDTNNKHQTGASKGSWTLPLFLKHEVPAFFDPGKLLGVKVDL